MSLVTRLLSRLRREIRTRALWSVRYNELREPRRMGGIDDTPEELDGIVAGLREAGIEVGEWRVDVPGYRAYLEQARYARWRSYQKGGRAKSFSEKSLEHYIASRVLELKAGETYIDIANDSSPVPEIYHDLFGCTVYRQDLTFPDGVHGNTIGSDAGAMPVADGFADAMALHCSFEHFENGSDSAFIREAGRVLKPGGRLCIVPLYMNREYSIITDPSVLPKQASSIFEPDAVLCCVRGYGNRHGRHYDVRHFVSRVAANRGALSLRVYRVLGAEAVSAACYVRFMAVLTKS